MRTTCIIPARGGSVRIPGKNAKMFHGTPMVVRAVELAQRSRLFDLIVVSTDSAEIAEMVERAGADVHQRDPDDGSTGTQTVAKDVIVQFGIVGHVCVLYPCSPLLMWCDLMRGYADSMLPGVVWAISTDRRGTDAGGYYWGPAAAFVDEVPLDQSAALNHNHMHFDINTPEDWAKAEEIYAALHIPQETVMQAPRDPGEPTSTLDFWRGQFGNEYTERNNVPWSDRVPFWRRVVDRTGATSFLDVGCNAGWNMRALRTISSEFAMTGIDINDHALQLAQAAGLDVTESTAPDLLGVMGHSVCDMVITSGVLIHVAPQDIEETMRAVVQLSGRWVVAVEYESPHEVEVEYRGHTGKLWKRPYGDMYAKLGLSVVEFGPADGFVDCTYWLLEKS